MVIRFEIAMVESRAKLSCQLANVGGPMSSTCVNFPSGAIERPLSLTFFKRRFANGTSKE